MDLGFPGGSVVKNPPANAGDRGDMSSIPSSGQSPGEGNGESQGQRSLAGDSPWGHKESDTTEQLNNNQWIQPLGVACPPDAHVSLLEPMSQSLARNLGPPLTLLAPFLSTASQQPILSAYCLRISLLPSLLLSHVSPTAAAQVEDSSC